MKLAFERVMSPFLLLHINRCVGARLGSVCEAISVAPPHRLVLPHRSNSLGWGAWHVTVCSSGLITALAVAACSAALALLCAATLARLLRERRIPRGRGSCW